ncbi:outer membrane protein [Mucilaginibacter dorajii]|uniref:Outer membrane protein beta-barrel domain-containing protein n=1 Tax=Mucilaginibacter dorajii TaxID=692994 RepID=A0ABP7QZW8_9SPHI|nr:outer membrane beta-barrel protein [Mucilaginibacter dorajii]MCS3732265.1 opacity protein-like surface antigen [Mucilaginibacter dorajii]
MKIRKQHSITGQKIRTKFFITLVCIGALTSAARAQNNDDPTARKLYLDFGGSVGVFIPYDQVKGQKTLTGSNAMTSLQLNYHQNYFIKLQFGQTTVNFKSQNAFGTLSSLIDAKTNSTNLGLNIGYQRSFGRWQPFVLAGAGASFIDVPATSFDKVSNTVNYTTFSGTYLYINAGAGINYKVSRSFTFYLEGQGSTIPNLPNKSSTHLSGISAMIGIKAPL